MQLTSERKFLIFNSDPVLLKKMKEAKKMINDLHLVYDRNSLRGVLLSFKIDIRKLKLACNDYVKFNELIVFYKTEMLGIEKGMSSKADFLVKNFKPVKRKLSNGKIVTDYYEIKH